METLSWYNFYHNIVFLNFFVSFRMVAAEVNLKILKDRGELQGGRKREGVGQVFGCHFKVIYLESVRSPDS